MTSVPPELDYHHLRYFWSVATEGSMSAAAKRLGVTQPTVSAQIQALEQDLRQQLFHRHGRQVELTAAGRVVFHYADEIFKSGVDLVAALAGEGESGPVRFEVGVGDAVPKLVAMAVLRPAYQIGRPVRVVVREWRMDQMLSELARERIDLVLSEAAAPSSAPGHPVSQMIGNSRVGIFGASELVENYRAGFPRSLDGAPLLLPVEGLPLRTSIDAWLNVRGIVPRIVGETEDRAMLHHLAMEGYGMVPIPEILATDIQRQFRVEAIGWLQGVREHYFAVWVARKQTHPAIQAIREQTKKGLLVADAGARALESRDGDVNSDAAGLDDGAG